MTLTPYTFPLQGNMSVTEDLMFVSFNGLNVASNVFQLQVAES